MCMRCMWEFPIDISRVGMHNGSQALSLHHPTKKINPHIALTAIHPSQPIHLTAKGGMLSYSVLPAFFSISSTIFMMVLHSSR